jgi:hypothetical protein
VGGKWADSGLGSEQFADLPSVTSTGANPVPIDNPEDIMNNAVTTTTSTATATSTATSTATRRLATRIGTGLAITGAAAALSFAGAGAASASSYGSYALAPGQGACSPTQYASYQVRADGWATGQGAKFKLLRNGQVILSTAGRYQGWAAELRTSYGTFAGPGYYSVCAQNTGTTNTIATLQLRTDYEF